MAFNVKLLNSRFVANLQEEPKQMLTPIIGYEKEPLLPLEEACEPLNTILKDLPQQIWVAKQNCKEPSDGLTQDESAAIYLYTMEWSVSKESLYSILNCALRQADRGNLIPWFRYLKLLFTALYKLPSESHRTVWRGVNADISSDYSHGDKKVWWSLSSCTSTLKILELPQYLGKSGVRTLFSIETSNGKSIRAHSYFKTVDEILLLPGSYFHVASVVSPADGPHIIHLKEKQPPFLLLQPPFDGAAIRQRNPTSAALESYFSKQQKTTTNNQSKKDKKKFLHVKSIISLNRPQCVNITKKNSLLFQRNFTTRKVEQPWASIPAKPRKTKTKILLSTRESYSFML
ncbi:unnamed protein product [Didymodactylos carnosus]|uniref:NAD(P)(+)--arginine ADP-ribosyltransferase n=1 Tax=Didymodactylos carnosus TaxID=1234261 RepID=A0A814NXP8_9BILA|nr:unnamed protein product [Didymodactylos carnosus]CAF1097294.1 unnamed protein product [Didymodactylos carnosus]CAF3585752.1 unnamed protein product [Didymodactylos carnosus]CAF3862449.1 unnamed protein product [Didymodactylos carnosus]